MASETTDPSELMQLAGVLAQRVTLREIFLQQSRQHRKPLTAEEIPDEISLAYAVKVSHKWDQDKLPLAVRIGFQLSGHDAGASPSEGDDEPERTPESLVFRIEATFVLQYELHDLVDISEKHIKAFARTNGIYNAWPYWREYVQAAIGRMSLPPLTLPVMTQNAIRALNETMTEVPPEAGGEKAAEGSRG